MVKKNEGKMQFFRLQKSLHKKTHARVVGERSGAGLKTEFGGLARDVNNFLSLYTLNGVYCPCASREKLKENKNTQDTVEPRYNERPRDLQSCSL